MNVDAIYIISAKDSKRRELARIRLEEQNIKFEFYDAIMIKEDPIKGCFMSHMNIIKKCNKKNYKRVLIFEDDVMFTRPLKNYINIINEFLDNHNWTIFYLGHRPLIMEKYDNNIYKCQSHDTHAYIINLNTFKDFFPYKPAYIKPIAAIDGLYSFQSNCYCIYPMLCVQDENLISQICNYIPKENLQLYAEKNVNNNFMYMIGLWNILLHKNHYKHNDELTTLMVPIISVIILCLIFIFIIKW